MESIPTMTNLLTIPHNVGRLIVEDGAMLCCRLLGTRGFVEFCGKRGISIDRSRLIRLERLGLFAPVFRVRAPQQPTDEFHIPPREGNNWFTKGLAEDTTAVPSNHVVPAHTDQNCEGYYSVFQINHLHHVLSRMTTCFQLDYYLEQSTCRPVNWQEKLDHRMEIAKMDASGLRDCQYHRAVALLCQHISNRYFPETQTDMRTRRTGGCEPSFDAWITVSSPDWNWHQEAQRWDPKRIETLYSLTPEKLRHAYKGLAMDQSDCDPIEAWYQLTQFISIDERRKLKGAALRSEIIRYGAQMLRFLYKDLYGDNLPNPNEVSRTIITPVPELEVRKDTRRYLEFVANRFGINPQPRLCLFVEGQTEEIAVTRIFEEYYGLHPGTCGIELIDLGGVDNATGNQAGSGGIVRLIDYLHHHQTVSFVILDNENRAKKFKKDLLKARSIHNNQRYVTQRRYVKILNNSFEFDNFSYEEIADALTKLAQDNVVFNSIEISDTKEDDKPGAALKNLYKEKVGSELEKTKLAEILIDIMILPELSHKIEDRPIVKILNDVARLAFGNCLPIMQEIRDANQRLGFCGRIKPT